MNPKTYSITITQKDLETTLSALLAAEKEAQTEATRQLYSEAIDKFYPHVGEPFKTSFDTMRRILNASP